MWNLINIKADNFFSYKEIDYSFQHNKCVMIYGLNESDEGTNSNGAGKSTIIELITLMLTGSTCRDVNKEDFINDNEDSFAGQIVLENKVLKQDLIIHRTFERGSKSSTVSLIENGKDNKKITSVLEANKRIIELIGISKEDLLHYFIIGQSTNHSFFSAGDAEKKEIISRLTNASILDVVIKEIKTRENDFDIEMGEIDREADKIKIKIESVEENIAFEKQNFEKTIKDDIKTLQDDSLEKRKKLKESEDALKKLGLQSELNKKAILEAEKKIEKQKDFVKIETDFKNDRLKITKEMNEAYKLFGELTTVLAGEVECPKCNNKFLPKSKMSLKEARNAKEETNDLLKHLDAEIRVIDHKLKQTRIEQSESQDQRIEIKELRSKLNIISQEVAHNTGKKMTMENAIEDNDEGIKKLQAELKKPSRLAELKIQLVNLNNELENVEKKIASKEVEGEMITFWKHHFSKKGFLTYLSNKAVKTIQGITNLYLRKFKTDLSVLINGFTQLKSGDVNEKIEIFIQRDGIEQGCFERYSGGEKARINLAGIIGLQKLINLSCDGRGLNFLAIDEVFESVDRDGQFEILSILERIGITTLIVSHMSDSIGAQNELFVEKKNGISQIITKQ